VSRGPGKPPLVLDYGHHEPAWRSAARVGKARADQGWLNLLRYWLWYYGGPVYCGSALGAGIAVAFLSAWVTHFAATKWSLYVGGLLVWVVIALRPRRREF